MTFRPPRLRYWLSVNAITAALNRPERKNTPAWQGERNPFIHILIMPASTTQVIAAHLTFNVEVRLSVEATEAKWKQLTKDYRDPEERWADYARDVITTFISENLDYQISDELTDRLTLDLPGHTICGLQASKPVIECSELDSYELEGLD